MFCKLYTIIFVLTALCQPSLTFRKKAKAVVVGTTVPDGFLPVCAKEIIKETCGLLHGGFTKENIGEAMGWLRIDAIKEMLAAHEDTFASLWKTLGFPPLPHGEALDAIAGSDEVKEQLAEYGMKILKHSDKNVLGIACEELCYHVRDYVETNYHLPPASDLACMVKESGIECDIDVRPEALQKLHRGGDMPDLHEEDVEQPDPKKLEASMPENTSLVKEPSDYSTIDYDIFEVLEGVAQLFRFYPLLDPSRQPEAPASLLQLSNGTQPVYNHYKTIEFGQKGIAYVNTVIREINLPSTEEHLKEWFGTDSSATKGEVLRVLNSVKHVLNNVHYEYPGPKCKKGVYAYVYPTAYEGCGTYEIRTEPCTKTIAGKYIYYLCDTYVNADDGAKIETLVHEGSHHYSARTNDVCADRGYPFGVKTDPNFMSLCNSKAYGRSTCVALATFDKERALKNADTHCYFVQAIADPVYHNGQRCNAGSNSLIPFADHDGDCQCPSGQDCHQGSSRGCPSSQSSFGYDTKFFSSTCINCKCGGSIGSITPTPPSQSRRCPSSAVSLTPDSDGECKCPDDRSCYTGSRLGCFSTVSRNGTGTKYFSASCTDCTCKVRRGWSVPPPIRTSTTTLPRTPGNPGRTTTTTTAMGRKCPSFARQTYPDSTGDCACPLGKKCKKQGAIGQCPSSIGPSTTYFKLSCTTCTCGSSGGSTSGEDPAAECPDFASSKTPSNGNCQCERGQQCYTGSTPKCEDSDGIRRYMVFKSSCTDCTCKDPNSAVAWRWPVLAILINILLVGW